MRSVHVFLCSRDAFEAKAFLHANTHKEDGYRIACQASDGAPILYIHVDDPTLIDSTDLEWAEHIAASEEQLGEVPTHQVSIDVTGRVDGTDEIRAFVVEMLRCVGRCSVFDDNSELPWTLPDIETGHRKNGDCFFKSDDGS